MTEYTSSQSSEDDEPPELLDVTDDEVADYDNSDVDDDSSLPELVNERETEEPTSSWERQMVAPPIHEGARIISHTTLENDEVVVYFADTSYT